MLNKSTGNAATKMNNKMKINKSETLNFTAIPHFYWQKCAFLGRNIKERLIVA